MTVISSATGGELSNGPVASVKRDSTRCARCSNVESASEMPEEQAATSNSHLIDDFTLPKLAPTRAHQLNATLTSRLDATHGNNNLSAPHLEAAQICHETDRPNELERPELARNFHKLNLGKSKTIVRWDSTIWSLVFIISFTMDLFATNSVLRTSSALRQDQRALGDGFDKQHSSRMSWLQSSERDYSKSTKSTPSARFADSHQLLPTTTTVTATKQSDRRHWAAAPSNKDKILLLHSRLQQLKRELDEELSSSGSPEPVARNSSAESGISQINDKTQSGLIQQPVSLGSPCLSSSFCSKFIKSSQCNLDTFTCDCLSQHVKLNSTTCLAPALLGYECQLDEQCRQRVPESTCQRGKCSCASDKFVAYKKNKCLAGSKLNEYCLLDAQCQLNDRHSSCRWKIQNVYGTCKCPPNYKLITDQENNLHCAPRLGDACLSDGECQLATANSICNDDEKRDQSRWATSSASNKRCTCADGFEWSRSKLDCLAAATPSTLLSGQPTRPPEVNSSEVIKKMDPTAALVANHQQDSHKYELVQVEPTARDKNSSSEQVELEIKLMPMNATTTTTKPPTTTTSSTTTTTTTRPSFNSTIRQEHNGFRMSSLGKPCKWRQECQLRDPNSDCIEGVCECLAPSSRCRASRTGCHDGTFQCRSGQCISWYFVCDQFRNCDDGSDEDECERPFHCPREAFQCQQDGQCVSKGKVCDGKRDCRDGSDELQCTRSASAHLGAAVVVGNNNNNGGGCPAGAFACSSGQCLPGYVFCNAVEDCQDGSDEDELICERNQRPQPPSLGGGDSSSSSAYANTSANSIASQRAAILNGSTAPVGDHAVNQPATLQPFKTTPTTDKPAAESPLVKTDRASIERLMASLALGQRAPLTPQERLKTTGRRSRLMPAAELTTTKRPANKHELVKQSQRQQQPPPDECPRHAFTCRNGKCRSSAILCSGVDGCGDNSDEDHCEVCQCEAPLPPPPPSSNQQHDGQQPQLVARAANSKRRNGWVTPPS